MEQRLFSGRPMRNLSCPYCGAELGEGARTKEHVIGRRFVPIGAFSDSPNVILWACGTCNRRKSDLEDDIAAITMHFHSVGLPQMQDVRLQAEAARRGLKSGSRRTGKAVAESHEQVSVDAKTPLFEVRASFASPPQLDDARAIELARLQLMGFFYVLTFDVARSRGFWWPGGFYPVLGTIKSDWGNPVHRVFAKQVANWDVRLVMTTADGYFRTAIRRHLSAECWSWAVEWNDCYRLVGYFGDQQTAERSAAELPRNSMHSIQQSGASSFSYRVEEPLERADDLLFC
jgi:hypothetical protein